MPRRALYVLVWLAAAGAAVAVGVLSVLSVGDTLRKRGPIGSDVRQFAERAEGGYEPDPSAERTARVVTGPYGEFAVACRGAIAYGEDTRVRDGWRVVSYEQGPDDDVDAVFARQDTSIEIEVYCNQGRPTVGDREVKTLPDDD